MPLKETIAGFEEILAGKLDDICPSRPSTWRGNIDEVKAKAGRS